LRRPLKRFCSLAAIPRLLCGARDWVCLPQRADARCVLWEPIQTRLSRRGLQRWQPEAASFSKPLKCDPCNQKAARHADYYKDCRLGQCRRSPTDDSLQRSKNGNQDTGIAAKFPQHFGSSLALCHFYRRSLARTVQPNCRRDDYFLRHRPRRRRCGRSRKTAAWVNVVNASSPTAPPPLSWRRRAASQATAQLREHAHPLMRQACSGRPQMGSWYQASLARLARRQLPRARSAMRVDSCHADVVSSCDGLSHACPSTVTP